MIAEGVHGEALRFSLRSGRHALVSDQRPEYGGEDAGPMPSELFMFAVASCFGQALAHVARKMRTPIDPLRVLVDARKHESEFRFARILLTIEARCPRERLEKIVEHAKKLCFVTNSISSSVEVDFELRAT